MSSSFQPKTGTNLNFCDEPSVLGNPSDWYEYLYEGWGESIDISVFCILMTGFVWIQWVYIVNGSVR